MPSPISDETEAYRRAEAHIDAFRTAIDVRARLEPGLRNAVAYEPEDLGYVEFDEDDEDDLPVNVEVVYDLVPSSAEGVEDFDRNRGYFTRLAARLREDGWIIIVEEREPRAVLTARHPQDDFLVTLEEGRTGNLWITASSPPVTATGITPPEPLLS
ncbi:hypothetical protein LX16_0451 [Stackebrandtia albiflava]|uniref:Uncharacterized protein n=1 Tax=Stackebrandtia albiflava TaxID=406432 RepID=A0A562VA93_9ACTN|nr:hypothetical protein [Stackebrandtia albiflava]TWJ14761.1 hypothetical protein LX16_0451 [Stackebrandtia albiflava]